MDSNSLPLSQPQVRPMNEPHSPITMDEMNPNIHNEPPKSAKGTLLTLASLLVLLGIVGITLFLYIQNKITNQSKNNQSANKSENISSSEQEPSPVLTQIPIVKVNSSVVCAQFNDLQNAIYNKDKACVLDLSKQNLTFLSDDVIKLQKLNSIDLSNNNFSEFPKQLLSLNLLTIDLSKNNISAIPKEITKLKKLQILNVTGNPITESAIATLKKDLPHAKIIN